MHALLEFLINALDDLFLAGMIGAVLVLLLTLVEDLKTMFSD